MKGAEEEEDVEAELEATLDLGAEEKEEEARGDDNIWKKRRK